mgnify:CR=1 FL=1
MSKLVHNIIVTVFEKKEKRIQNIFNAFEQLLPIDFQKEKITLTHEKAEGFHQKIIHILTMKTSRKRHNRLLLKTVFEMLSENEKKTIENQLESRIDEDGNFYIRLDKQSLLNNKYKITEKGDCFHFKIKLAAFPASRVGFLESADELIHRFD